jgi:endonuclease/exonuclease/phosphatase family metal-dependent hydrolase
MRICSIHGLALALGALASAEARAASGTFTTLTYNVAGLPQGISSAPSDRQSATELMSCYVKDFDIVNVQEDFNYHAALYDTCDDHPYRTPTSGGAALGSGLNTLSRFPTMDFERVRWNACNGVDCLTPKGFTLARVRLSAGVYVDVYNLHAQAQTSDADLSARRDNVRQLVDFIESHSAGRAVIVMGDTNTRYTRAGDNIWELLRRGSSDAWVDLLRGGAVPVSGAADLTCGEPAYTSPSCEIVDKVFYRDNGYVGLKALTYVIRTDAQNGAGQELSDHRPVEVTWSWSTPSDRQMSDTWGGPHGDAFDDVYSLPSSPAAAALALRSGARLDHVEIALSNGSVLSHGGNGGTQSSLALAQDEYLSSVHLCQGKHNGTTRIFYAGFVTSAGRMLAGGSVTSNCATYSAPAGWQIVGFHGRSADEVDELGVVFAPRIAKPGPSPSFQLASQLSGQCLDITGIAMADGTNIEQWPCNGGDWQRWIYDDKSGLIRSQRDPRFCLDNSGSFADGASALLWTCSGNANQRFTFESSTGAIGMRTFPAQVLEVAGQSTAAGANVGTRTWWGGSNQRWRRLP